MNNTFDWNRFGKLLVHNLKTFFPKPYLTLLLLAICPVFLWAKAILFGTPDCFASERWALYLFGLYIIAILAPSGRYGKVNLPNRGIGFAMLPASKLEKYLGMIFITLIFCPVLYLTATIAFDTLLWLIPFGPFNEPLFQRNELIATTPEEAKGICLVIIGFVLQYISTHATFFFTNTIFKRHKILYTFVSLWVLFLILMTIIVPILFQVGVYHESWVEARINAWVGNMSQESEDKVMTLILSIGIALEAIYSIVLYVWSWFRIKKARY